MGASNEQQSLVHSVIKITKFINKILGIMIILSQNIFLVRNIFFKLRNSLYKNLVLYVGR